jgi:hypothetical protein
VPLPPRALATRLGGLTGPVPEARPWAPVPSSLLQAALLHDRRRLTRTVPHDTIPIRLYRLGGAAAQCNHVLSIMGNHDG